MRPRGRSAAVAVVAASLVASLVTSFAAGAPAHAAPPRHHRDSLDGDLRVDIDQALAHHITGLRDPLVRVEVLASDNAAVASEINRLAGTVTGSVPGQLVEALVPAGAVDSLAELDAARYLQRPVRVNRIAPTAALDFGPTAGSEATVTNAAAWQAAGITGNVKVGIIDFFDLTFWDTDEHGPVPDAAHQFCPTQVENLCTPQGQINSAAGDRHGVAVAEVVKDMAPGAELYLATTGTTADVQKAIDWFAVNDVHIVTRSLGAPYDGPGDGTGPLDTVVDSATAHGITWFNSAGNDAFDGYGRYTNGVDASGYVDFDNGPAVDTILRIDPAQGGVAFAGIRWANDWYAAPGAVTDYSVEVWVGTNDSTRSLLLTLDDAQTGGAPPLEAVDFGMPVDAGKSVFLRIHADAHYTPSAPDTIEIAMLFGGIEPGRRSVAYSAAKPVVDSRSPALVAVGAIVPATSANIADYSAQGPTNDGRIKPDVVGPACLASTIYASYPYQCFNGTSASTPVAAGMAALLLDADLAEPGVALGALTRHLVRDLGTPGVDSTFGAGELLLPAPPSAVDSSPSTFAPLGAPVRLLDTRPASFTGPSNLRGPFPQFSIVDLPVMSSGIIPPGASAIAINLTSTDSLSSYYVQALPTLGAPLGAFSTLNVATPGDTQPNFAIVPIAQGSISIFIPTGGNVIVDALGYFVPSDPAAAGRFVPLDPRRVLDTRPDQPGPVPAGWIAHQPAAGETVRVDVPADAGVPSTGVSALVVNLTATDPQSAGYLQALPTGATTGSTSNVNYAAGETAATQAIVPVGAGGTISVFTYSAAHIVVDVMGYITDSTAASSGEGRFVPIPPGRYYDSRTPPQPILAAGSNTTISLAGIPRAGAPLLVPAGASAVSTNLTSDQAQGAGFLTAYPSDGPLPLASNLNFVAGTAVANAALVELSASGTVNAYVSMATHVIIDVDGYFTGTQ